MIIYKLSSKKVQYFCSTVKAKAKNKTFFLNPISFNVICSFVFYQSELSLI
jgi:hypothetical protein